jgi:hypothetical protein
MIKIKNTEVDDDILKEYFSCDVERCNGACCTFPGQFGAPVLDEEVPVIKESTKFAIEYLSDSSKSYIKEHGVIDGEPGNYTTVCIDKRDCVFVNYDGAIARCAIERAYFEGKIKYQKPVSCHLFPIRVSRNRNNHIYYERINECYPGKLNGQKMEKYLYQYLEEALIRSYGKEWYKSLNEYAELKQQKRSSIFQVFK